MAWRKITSSEQAKVKAGMAFFEKSWEDLPRKQRWDPKKNPNKYKVYIETRGQPREIDPEVFEQLSAKAKANLAKVPSGSWDEDSPIAFRRVEVLKHEETVPIPPKPKAQTFDAGSTFPSAKYKAGDMNSAEFNKIMAQAANYLSKLQEAFGPEVKLKVSVEAGESQVTPPKGMKTGDLANLRAQTAIEQASKYFAAAGFDLGHIDFVPVTTLGSTTYTSDRNDPNYRDKHSKCYTDEQYLKVTVEMSGEPKIPKPIVYETYVVEAIFLSYSFPAFKPPIEWPEWEWPGISITPRPRGRKPIYKRSTKCTY